MAYCKALVFVGGAGRRARDWIAGWASVMPASNRVIVMAALQHEGTAADGDAFAALLAAREASGELSPAAARLVVRCFLFDCATLAALTCHGDETGLVRDRLDAVAARFGVAPAYLAELVDVAREERELNIEKYQALEEEDVATTPERHSPWSH
jgi:hypothetical protein